MRLGDADRTRDLRFGHVGVEPEEDDPALPVVERPEPTLEQNAVLASGESVGVAGTVNVGVSGRGERHRIASAVGGHQPLDLGHVGVERGRDLGHLRRTSERGGELVAGAPKLAAHALDVAGQPHPGRPVPKMPADLTFDGGRDEGRERDPPARIEAARGLD